MRYFFIVFIVVSIYCPVLGEGFPQLCFEQTEEVVTEDVEEEVACFDVDLATTTLARQKGLMYKKDIPENFGMLFAYPKDKKIIMWMKNTFVSLDIIWLDEEFKIIDFVEKTKPLSTKLLFPKTVARYVLEVQHGTVRR